MPSRNRYIPLFKPNFRVEECLEAIKPALEIGWSGQGYLTPIFEEQWNAYTGVKNSIFLNSASAALHLALESMKRVRGWGLDSEIISSPMTFVSTNHAILWAELKPVLVDVDESLCLDPMSIISAITPKTKAVMYVAIGGNDANFAEVKNICEEYGLALILDAAHASGSRSNGKHIGADVDATCYSFQAVKNLPTADSGLLSLKDDDEHELAKKLSWLGISESTFERNQTGKYKWEYEVDNVGFKDNGNSVMAALAGVGLKYLEYDNAERRKIAHNYQILLRGTEDIQIITHNNENETSRHLFQIAIPNRKKVSDYLGTKGIGFGVHYRTNTSYPMYSHFSSSTLNATYYSERILSLPLYVGLTTTNQEYIADCIRECFK